MVHKIVRAHNKVVSIPNLIFWNFEKKTERWANEKRAGRSLSFSNYFFSSLFSSLNNVKWSTAAFVALTSFAIFFIIEGKWASKYFCHFRNSLRAVQIKSDLETLDTRGHAVLLILKFCTHAIIVSFSSIYGKFLISRNHETNLFDPHTYNIHSLYEKMTNRFVLIDQKFDLLRLSCKIVEPTVTGYWVSHNLQKVFVHLRWLKWFISRDLGFFRNLRFYKERQSIKESSSAQFKFWPWSC